MAVKTISITQRVSPVVRFAEVTTRLRERELEGIKQLMEEPPRRR